MRAALSGLLLLPAAALRVGVSPVRPVRRTPGFVRSAVSADLPATHASEDEFEVTKAEVARIRKELRAKETELSRTRGICRRALKRLRGGGDTGGDRAASTPGAHRSTTSRYFAAAQRVGRGSDQVKVES